MLTILYEALSFIRLHDNYNSIDYRERLSVASCVESDYLTIGLLRHHHESFKSHFAEDMLPIQLNPSSLHKGYQSRVELPILRNKPASDGSHQLWARRQFSVLWAPMPAEYSDQDTLNVTMVSYYVLRSYFMLADLCLYESSLIVFPNLHLLIYVA